jgi:hypothetical protein
VFETVDALRRFPGVQRLLDIAVAIVRLCALKGLGQPVDDALEESCFFVHLLLHTGTCNCAGIFMMALVADAVQIGIRAPAI